MTDLTHLPKTGVAQAQTVAQWVVYLSWRRSLSSSLLKEELQKILGLLMYHSDEPEETVVAPPAKCLLQEGKYPTPEDVWYTDGFRKDNPSKYRAVAYHPSKQSDLNWEIIRIANGQNCEVCGQL